MTKFFVKRPIFTFSFYSVLFLIGIFSIRVLSIDFFPEISIPMVSIITIRPGASPEEVEREVTKYIEDAVSTAPNVTKIRSLSIQDISAVTVEFDWGTDIDKAADDIRTRIEFAKFFLPEDVEIPKVFKFDLTQIPILVGTFSVKDTLFDLLFFFENEIFERLRRIPGVGEVQYWGGGRREIVKIELKKKYIEEYGITPFLIKETLLRENINVPIGNVEDHNFSISAKVNSKFSSLEEIKNIPIHIKGRGVYKLSEIADVKISYDDVITKVRSKKTPSILFGILKQSGANTVLVSERVKKEIDRILKDYPGIELKVVNDISRFIRASIQNLTNTIYWAVLFIFIVTLIFLRHLSSSFVIAVTIPFSLLVGFIVLKLTGGSINIISLSALALAAGMVVDNAVVVLENIFFKREKGENPLEAAYKGAIEVFTPILASTLTTIAIFGPLVVGTGFVGIMFRQLALMVTTVLLTSLLVSLTLTPTLSRIIIKKIPEEKGILFYLFEKLKDFYRKTIDLAISRKFLTLLFGFLLFVFGILLFLTGSVKTEFFPESDSGELRGNFILPPGTKFEVTDSVSKIIEDIISNIEEVKYFTARVGRSESGFLSVMGVVEGENTGFFFINIGSKDQRNRSIFEISEFLENEIKKIPGIKSFQVLSSGNLQNIIQGFGAPIQILIYGEDFNVTDSIAEYVKEILKNTKGIRSIRTTREKNLPEYLLIPDRDKISKLGLYSSSLGAYLRSLNFGEKVGVLKIGNRELDIKILIEEDYRKNKEILPFISFPLVDKKLYIGNIFRFEKSFSPLSIERENKERVIKVLAETSGRPLGEIRKELEEKLKNILGKRGEFRVEFGGLTEEQAESFKILLYAFLIGIVIVYLVMAAQFESFLLPFIIMFTIPSGITGVALIHILTDTTFSVPSFVGLIMMIGIVVNNAIVMLDYVERLRNEGKKILDATKEGVLRRLRPILITSFTTIMGLTPLVILRGEGSETWKPLALSVIGGLSFSLLVSLVFIPTMYVFVQEKILKRI
ncbi:MAG: efflux RND transporter permease subunit [Candidatus Hydrothermales bacterium]